MRLAPRQVNRPSPTKPFLQSVDCILARPQNGIPVNFRVRLRFQVDQNATEAWSKSKCRRVCRVATRLFGFPLTLLTLARSCATRKQFEYKVKPIADSPESPGRRAHCNVKLESLPPPPPPLALVEREALVTRVLGLSPP